VRTSLTTSALGAPLRLGSLIGVIVVLAAACGGGGDGGSAQADSITVASFDFSESETLGELYAQALEANGFTVERAIGAGPRELVEPALEQGAADLAPEYVGSALQFVTRGTTASTADTAEAHGMLTEAYAGRGLKPLAPAPAEDKNTFVVTRATAERLGVAKLSDLQPVAGELVFGGPPECPQRPLCLQGLKSTYDLTFKEVRALDPGGPKTVEALQTGDIDVGLLFTTSPALTAGDMVELEDDKHLQPAENVVPVVRTEVLDRHGPRLAAVLDAVSARLDTETLTQMNKRVEVDKQPSEVVVKEWLSGQPDLRG
ncbi:MAG: ABC transporter substrate-binding protein, partial [Actinomycetota bacterium]|nr:ABC transporter substrate-binding protein [Actinomycetota bacterium]